MNEFPFDRLHSLATNGVDVALHDCEESYVSIGARSFPKVPAKTLNLDFSFKKQVQWDNDFDPMSFIDEVIKAQRARDERLIRNTLAICYLTEEGMLLVYEEGFLSSVSRSRYIPHGEIYVYNRPRSMLDSDAIRETDPRVFSLDDLGSYLR